MDVVLAGLDRARPAGFNLIERSELARQLQEVTGRVPRSTASRLHSCAVQLGGDALVWVDGTQREMSGPLLRIGDELSEPDM